MMNSITASRLSSLHLTVLACFIFLHALNLGAAYKAFSYINIAIVIFYGVKDRSLSDITNHKKLIYIIIAPTLLILFHIVAVGKIEFTKEMRGMIVSIFLSIGIPICLIKNYKYKKLFPTFAAITMLVYTLIQGGFIFLLGHKYGTTKNPHYLAQYCLLLLPIAVYLYHITSGILKLFITTAIPVLFLMLLQTSSRPAWIGLFLALGLLLFHLPGIKKSLTLAGIVVVLVTLYTTNILDFGSRVEDLYTNIKTEERVYIWKDALAMQQKSSTKQWVFGHGLDRFKNEFTDYSSYHQTGRDFNSPHNFFIEILYTSGIFGLLVIISFFAVIYRNLIRDYLKQGRSAYLLMLITVLTANLALVSITIPFFTSYNIIILGLIGGLIIYLNEDSQNRKCNNLP